MQSDGFDAGKGRWGYFAESQMAAKWLSSLVIGVRKVSELGSIKGHYTEQTDLKQIVSQNKLMLLYFHIWKKYQWNTSVQYRECLQYSKSDNIKSRTRLLK